LQSISPSIEAVCRKTLQDVNRDSRGKSEPKEFRKKLYVRLKIGTSSIRFHLLSPEAELHENQMSTAPSISDPKTLFDRWFEQPIAQLQKLDNEDGGTAGMMIVLPLFERYITILNQDALGIRSWPTN